MNDDNKRHVSEQPGAVPSADTPEINAPGNTDAVFSQAQDAIPAFTETSQTTESIINQASQNQTMHNQATPNQGNNNGQGFATRQSHQTAPSQSAPQSQPQYQPYQQQAAPSQAMNGQQYQSQSGGNGGYHNQNGAPYGPGSSTPPAGNYSRTKGFAITSLICGICSVVLCCLGFLSLLAGIAAIVFGILVLSDTEKNGALYPDSKTMRGMAIAGLVCGIIGTIFGLFALIGIPSIFRFIHHDSLFDDFDSFGSYMDF